MKLRDRVLPICIILSGIFGGYLGGHQIRMMLQKTAMQGQAGLQEIENQYKAEISRLQHRIEAIQDSQVTSRQIDERMESLLEQADYIASTRIESPSSHIIGVGGVELDTPMDMVDDHREDEWQQNTLVSGFPLKHGIVSSNYGYRQDPYTGEKKWHSGLDIAAKFGSEVLATANGVVVFAGKKGQYGNMVEIKHANGVISRYAHCSKVMVKSGDIVQKTQLIAKVGSTGRSTADHLHYEISINGSTVDPTYLLYRIMPNKG